jgi:mannosyltransferase
VSERDTLVPTYDAATAAVGSRARSVVGRGFRGPALVLVVCSLTAILGGFRLGAKSVWTDEAFSVAVARLDPITMARAVTRGDAFNALYYAILHVWRLLGESETWIRLPSVAFGAMATYTLFLLNDRLFGRRVALTAAILLLANTFFVYYEQDARPYTLAIFLVILASYLLTGALDRPTTTRWLAYGLVAGLAVYAHFFAAFVIAAHAVCIALRRPRPRLRQIVVGFGSAAIVVAPLVIVVLRTDSLERRFIDAVHLGSFRWLFLNLTGAGGIASLGGMALLLSYFAVCCVALIRMGVDSGRSRRDPSRTWAYAFVLSWLAVPILGAYVISLIRPPIFYPRYLILTLPALVTVAAIGVNALATRWTAVLVAGLVVSLSIPPLVSYYRGTYKEGEDWRSAATYVLAHADPGDGVVFLSRYGRRSFEYYVRRFGTDRGLRPIYPAIGWGRYTPVLDDLRWGATAAAADRMPSYQRVWVILVWEGFHSVDEDPQPLVSRLRRSFAELSGRSFGSQVRVVLYHRIG